MKKKLLTLLLAGCMVLSMSACSKEEAKDTEDAAQQTEETEETEGTDESKDAAEVDNSALGTSTLTELGQYKGVTYVPYPTAVTDEEVEQQVQNLVANSTIKKNQETVTETSVVNIDYEGKKDGVAFDGGTAQGQQLDIANNNYIEGFASSIVGMKVGETKDCPMTFPEDYGNEELNGADVVFTITVNECWENIPAQLDDEFAVSKGYDDVDALYAGVREEYENSKQEEAKYDMQYQLLQTVIADSTFDLNEEEVELYVSDLRTQYETYASYYGVDFETYVTTALNVTLDEFEEQSREIALYRIQCPLVQSAVAEAEGMTLTDEEYTSGAQEYMEYYGYTSLEEFEADYTKETITKQLLANKALDFIVDNAVAAEE